MKIFSGIRYNLNCLEQELIEFMSSNICKQGREYFKSNYQVDKSLGLNNINVNGFGAELAFCQLCGVSFDPSFVEYESHFNKVDATLMNGVTVDVKQTKYNSGRLLVSINKTKKYVDIYALIIGVFPNYRFMGWATYEEMIRKENIRDLGHGPGYVLDQNKLHTVLNIL